MQPDDERVAAGAVQLGAAPELVVQALLGNAFCKLAGDLLRIRALFQAGIAALFAQEAADVVLVFFGELVQRQAELVEVAAALDLDLLL